MKHFSLVMIIVGGVLGYFGYQEWQLQQHATAEPEAIALEALIKRGPSGNTHVEIRDFTLCGQYVYMSKNNTWQSVYVPIEPFSGVKVAGQILAGLLGGGKPAIKDVKAMLVLKNIQNHQALETFLETHETVKGLVVNNVRSLEDRARELLQQSYPGIQFDTVIMLEAGRSPMSSTNLTLILVGSAALILLGLGMIIWSWMGSREKPYRGPEQFNPQTDGQQPA